MQKAVLANLRLLLFLIVLGVFGFFQESLAQVCATGGTCKAGSAGFCPAGDTRWPSGDAFCNTTPLTPLCCVTTATLCPAPKTCEVAISCETGTTDNTKLCASGTQCCNKKILPPGSCITPTNATGSCNQNCPTGTSAVSGSVGCANAIDRCCVASAGTTGSCITPTNATGSCNQNCPTGTSAVSGATGCPVATDKCCVGSGTGPAPDIKPITFDPPTGYTTVNEFLGKVLSWLQGVLGMLALVMITIGGFMYITSAGDSSRTETAKKLITAAVIGFAIAIAAPSFLRELSIILAWGPAASSLPPGVGTSLSFLQILTNVLNFLLSIVGVVGIIMLVVGGVMYLTSTGDEDRIDTGKSIVKYAVIGIGVALGALVLVRQLANFFS